MMFRIFFLTILFLNTSIGFTQDDVKRVKKRLKPGTETYYVLKSNPNVKHGDYLYSFGEEVSVRGKFKQNLREGNWNFNNYGGFRIDGFYIDGKKESVWSYFENNILLSQISYVNDKRHGRALGYHKNGKIKSIVPFVNGGIEGTKKLFYEDGSPQLDVDYSNGAIHGDLKYFDKSGKTIIHIIYRNGRPYSIEELSPPDSLKYYSGDLKDGNGTINIYIKRSDSDSLILKSAQIYKNGKLNGKFIEHSTKGKPLFTGSYANDFMDGKWYFYSIFNDKPPAMKEIPLKDSLRTIPSDMYSIIPTFFAIYNQSMPRFGSNNKNDFKYHVQQHLQYPLLAEDVWIRGTVYTQFDVDVTGKLINIKSLNKPHQELINEAFRVLETSPPWIPGFLDNIPHETIYTFPITFILE